MKRADIFGNLFKLYVSLIIYGFVATFNPLNTQAQQAVMGTTIMNLRDEVFKDILYPGSIHCEGTFVLKDGILEDLSDIKFTFRNAPIKMILNDSLVVEKKVTFEQHRAMILPVMKMVHVVGSFDIDGVKSTSDFQFSFVVNDDQSLTFKGTKLMKMVDLEKEKNIHQDASKIKDELKFDLEFVLKNGATTMTSNLR